MKIDTVSCSWATYTKDVESCLNYSFFYFFSFSAVSLRCFLLDSSTSSQSLTSNFFCKHKWRGAIFRQSDSSFLFSSWRETLYFTSALKQTHLWVEHKLYLALHLQNTGTLSVVLLWAVIACSFILQLKAGFGISKLIVDGRGINSDIEKLRPNTPYLVWIL